jgi:uncharacterized protein YifE (UPF0438 family)
MGYLRRKNYSLRCDPKIFTSAEQQTLRELGNWFTALVEGKISPVTDAQRHFIQVSNGTAEPTTDFEKLWWRYKQRIELEKEGETPRYFWSDTGGSWVGESHGRQSGRFPF